VDRPENADHVLVAMARSLQLAPPRTWHGPSHATAQASGCIATFTQADGVIDAYLAKLPTKALVLAEAREE
jgi:hypothetical protein